MSEKAAKYKATARKKKTTPPTPKLPLLLEAKPQTETARIERKLLMRVDQFAMSLNASFPAAVNILVDLALSALGDQPELVATKLDVIHATQRGVVIQRGSN